MIVLTSWDDGHPLDMRLGELLCKHGLVGTFFVPITNRENKPVMDTAQLRQLNKAHEIGSHTLTHQYLLDCPSLTAKQEINEGKQRLEEKLGHHIHGFCYPGGWFNTEISQLVKAAGFSYARTIENLCIDTGINPWHMPTTIQFYPHDTLTLAKNALRHWSLPKLPFVLKRLTNNCFYTFARQMAEQCAEVNGVFHLWGHSWEIEEHNLWAELDRFLCYLATMSTHSYTLEEILSVSFPISRSTH